MRFFFLSFFLFNFFKIRRIKILLEEYMRTYRGEGMLGKGGGGWVKGRGGSQSIRRLFHILFY